jgi:hypothetical protein
MTAANLPPEWSKHMTCPLIGSAQLRRTLRKNMPTSRSRQLVEALLKGCTPKTSPLYLRMIHATAYWLMENEDADSEASIKLIKSVAESVKRFDLTLD